MLEFMQDTKEAARIYHEHGYALSAWPRKWGKRVQQAITTEFWKYDFPWDKVNDNLNIGINNYLSKTCSIDVDRLELSVKAFAYLGIDLHELAQTSMCWRGRPNTYKIMFKSPDIKLNWAFLSTDKQNVVFELRGAVQNEVIEDAACSYMDVIPPSIHPNTKLPYEFITRLYKRDDLPELPYKLVEVWQNWDHYKNVLYSHLYN